MSLPEKKRQRVLDMVEKFSSIKSCSIRDFAKFLGVLVSICPVVKYGWLYTKGFERHKFLALKESHNNYNSRLE